MSYAVIALVAAIVALCLFKSVTWAMKEQRRAGKVPFLLTCVVNCGVGIAMSLLIPGPGVNSYALTLLPIGAIIYAAFIVIFSAAPRATAWSTPLLITLFAVAVEFVTYDRSDPWGGFNLFFFYPPMFIPFAIGALFGALATKGDATDSARKD